MTEVQGRTASKHRRGPAKRSILLPVVLILAGVLVLLYPVVATQWNNHRQQGIAAEYARIQEETPPSVLQEQFEAATRYNQTKGEGPILDPWLSRITPDNAEWQEYMSYLGGDGVMARLVVPSAKIDLPVYHGTSSSTLDKGVGHLFGTDLPVGGSGTHAVLTAHTGLTVQLCLTISMMLPWGIRSTSRCRARTLSIRSTTSKLFCRRRRTVSLP